MCNLKRVNIVKKTSSNNGVIKTTLKHVSKLGMDCILIYDDLIKTFVNFLMS